MAIVISAERPDSIDARNLVEELEAQLAPLYPRESRHGYSVDELMVEGVYFVVIRDASTPAGCAGVQLFGSGYGELKRMYVRPQFRRSGFAKSLLQHLSDYARSRGVRLLRLETGIHQQAAIRLYEQAGFRTIPPFGAYKDDPLNRFYEKRI